MRTVFDVTVLRSRISRRLDDRPVRLASRRITVLSQAERLSAERGGLVSASAQASCTTSSAVASSATRLRASALTHADLRRRSARSKGAGFSFMDRQH